MKNSTLRNPKIQDCLFPLGGIGTDCITLSKNGTISEPDILKNKDKNNSDPLSFFAVKAEKDGVFTDARLLFSGNTSVIETFIPHFTHTNTSFRFPYAETSFLCENFPGKVKVCAFNPFIPFNDSDSSIPAAFFEFEIENTTDTSFDYTICGVLENPFENGKNTFDGDVHTESKGIRMFSADDFSDDGSLDSPINAKNLYISTDFEDVSYQEYLKRGSLSEKISVFFDDFTQSPSFKNRSYKDFGDSDSGLIAAHFNLKPGQIKTVRFVISWYVRYVSENSKNLSDDQNRNCKRNYYCRFFSNSTECAAYCYTHWDRLKKETDLFSDTLYSSTLEPEVLESIASNLLVLKSSSLMRDKDGNIIDFKNGNVGSVYNFEYALCHLFPKLARGMREKEYFLCMNEDGALSPCIPYPLGSKPSDHIPCADGQLGSILKTYREFKMCGDIAWLKKIWPYAKHCLDYALKADSENGWDKERSGVFGGYQKTSHTSISFSDPYTQGLYVCALTCAAEMATILKEKDIANEYAVIAEKAGEYLNSVLFNGKEFSKYDDDSIFYQLIPQWHGNNIGLSEIIEKETLLSALDTVYEKAVLTEDENTPSFLVYPTACLMLQNKKTDSGLEMLRRINKSSKDTNHDLRLLSSYTLLNAATGLLYDMHRESISFDPVLSFSQKGYFNCFFAAGEAFGMIEVGPRYIEMKLLCGQFKLRRFGLFKEPKVVYYGGRKFDFKADKNTAVFDVSLICNKEKSILVIFD